MSDKKNLPEELAKSAAKPDLGWRLVGGAVALGVGFATRKLIEFGWRKATGKKPPANPESLEVSLAEAVGFAVVMGVGMEVTRIVAARIAAKRYQSWITPAAVKQAVKDAVD
ncbi:DUF4235 domain-containing protein [Sinosporangium siamense]|uniref:DUF4235 domain-containing protein n=1 Tax=Sinosporangium siamense TaxID=1367973 RepID=A0A919RDM7_9ACTN|nr:DUF4235 domain-containing protein [Sinosporangium siamense]GII91986.1 hypothetical protein Ssi02_22170 [Sinosporangium siamense]